MARSAPPCCAVGGCHVNGCVRLFELQLLFVGLALSADKRLLIQTTIHGHFSDYDAAGQLEMGISNEQDMAELVFLPSFLTLPLIASILTSQRTCLWKG